MLESACPFLKFDCHVHNCQLPQLCPFIWFHIKHCDGGLIDHLHKLPHTPTYFCYGAERTAPFQHPCFGWQQSTWLWGRVGEFGIHTASEPSHTMDPLLKHLLENNQQVTRIGTWTPSSHRHPSPRPQSRCTTSPSEADGGQ